MSKKKVTAPLTYNPGKGRPKEYLAYLNWQEMQELQRINGGNMERGPRGLPSFADDSASSKGVSRGGQGAVGSGSTKTSTGSVSKSSSSSKTTSSNKSGPGSTGGSKTAKSSTSIGGGGGGAGRDSSRGLGVGAGGSAIGRGGGGGKGGVGGQKSSTQKAGMNARDAQFKQIAESTRASAALKKSPAAGSDLTRGGIKTLNVGPMGTPVNVKTGQASGQIKGAISRVAQTPVKSPMAGQGASFGSTLDARIDTFQRINDARLATKKVFEGTTPRAPQGVFGPRVPVGTGYLRTATMPGMITTGMTSPYSGVAPPRFNAEQTLRAYEAEKRASVKDQSRLPTTSPTLPSLSRPAYGTTGLSSLSRPAYESAGLASLARPAYEARTPSAYTGYGSSNLPKPPPGETVLSNRLPERLSDIGAPPYAGTGGYPSMPFSADSVVMKGFTPNIRVSETPPYAGTEKVLSVESLPSEPRPGYSRVTNIFATNPRKLTGDLRQMATEGYEKFRPGMEDTAAGVPGPETPDTDFVGEYPRVDTKEKISPLGPRSYDTPYPIDEYGVPIQNVSADDLAKIRTRRRGEEYVPTPQEKNAIRAGKIVTRVVTSRIPGLNKVINTEEKMKDFYSRPSWEQEYIAQRASDWAAIRGDRKVTEQEAKEIEQRTGRGISKFTGGGIGDLGGRGGDNVYSDIVKDIPQTGGGGISGGEAAVAATTSARPYIYYEWDLGINVPSPGEPKYTEYQKYLQERADAQKALGLV